MLPDGFEFDKNRDKKQKYTINIFGGDDAMYSYLGYYVDDGDYPVESGIYNQDYFSTTDIQNPPAADCWCFTKNEIERLNKLDYLAIDWSKAIIEPVEEDNDED